MLEVRKGKEWEKLNGRLKALVSLSDKMSLSNNNVYSGKIKKLRCGNIFNDTREVVGSITE